MNPRNAWYLLLAGLAAVLVALPVAAAPSGPTAQTLAVSDSRTGDGPCGFDVRRDIEGTVTVTPSIDEGGRLVLAIESARLHGSLTNPANDKSVELGWVQQNGEAGFRIIGSTISLDFTLTGYVNPGYDSAGSRSDLTMDLPADGAAKVDFVAGEWSEEPWARVCGLLA